jgi:hypothetical protein
MLREVIVSPKVTEIYTVSEDLKRGSVVVKNLTTGKADAASGEGVDVYILDADNQPTGHLADVDISAYDPQMDTVKAGSRAVLIKYGIGGQFATDQVVATGLTAGDYVVAGTSNDKGKLVKAESGSASVFKYLGTYADGDKTLYRFEVVNPVTVE